MVFEEILKSHKGNIFRVCKMFSSDFDEQKDLFQEIDIQLHKSLPTFKGNSTLKTFVYRIALNTSIRYKNKFYLGIKKTSIEDIEWFVSDDSDQKLSQQERIEQLYVCISTLKDADKSMVLLYLEDLNYVEISQITGLSENHIAVKMTRIREKLFNCLTHKLI